MAKRKQQQDAAELDSKAVKLEESSKKETTLPSLWTLPEEIRAYIVRMVCARPIDQAEDAATTTIDLSAPSIHSWRVDLDFKTVCDLTLVSHEFHAYFTPLLYAHVRLEKPSALAQFHAGLLSRPSSLLVKSMHVGPLSEVHENYWPLRTVNGAGESPREEGKGLSAPGFSSTILFRSGLTALEERLRPRWCEGDKDFTYLRAPKHERERAAYEAIAVAVDTVDVATDLDYLYGNSEGEFIGIVEWTKRVYDAQGALDLYLSRMRQVEDTRSSIDESFEGYPRLVVEGFSEGKQTSNEETEEIDKEPRKDMKDMSPPASDHSLVPSSKKDNTFVVTLEQIRAHHSRPGAHTDHFDHPLVFAREDLRYLVTNDRGEGKVDEDQAVYVEEQDYRVEGPAKKRERRSLFPQWRDGTPALGRSVLRLTPHVKNLSLTGLFHDCLSAEMMPVLSQIRYLSVGPLTPHSHASLCIREEATMLPAVEKLRVCGNFPGIGAARLIGGEAEGLPSLKEAYWDFGHTDARSIGGGGEEFLWKMLNIMRGADETTEQYGPTKDHEPPCHYVEARLHPNLVTAMLSKARTPEIRAALSGGLPASDALRPLRIVQSRASSEERHWKSSSQKFDVLRQESQDWWKECVVELERRERQREGA